MSEITLANLETLEGKKIEVKLYYDLGGMNYFTGNAERRGYYLSVTPYGSNGSSKVYTAFTGTKILLLEVKRKGKKAQEQAMKRVDEFKNELVKHVCSKNKLTLKE